MLLTKSNKCSIIILVNKQKKEKPIISNGVGCTYSDRLFYIHIYKFTVRNGQEFETAELLHDYYTYKISKNQAISSTSAKISSNF